MSRILSILLALALFASPSFGAATPESFADLAQKVKPSVVNISTEKVMKNRGGPHRQFRGDNEEFYKDFFGDEFFKKFFGENERSPEYRTNSLGSGFIWDREGHIVTNNHVVEGADEIIVRLEGGKKYEAKMIGSDPDTDLAVLKIEDKKARLEAVDFGDSDRIRVGEWVVAVGNPFGYGHTVTAGIVSAKERVIGSGPYDSFLQTDAAINPGNSGGPLFDAQGRVVGINTAIISGGNGIGFAIPINMARDIVGQLVTGKKVTRAWLGVMIQPVTDEIADSLKLAEARGALVSDVFKGGPAEKAGIERGDVILRFDGKTVDRQSQLPYIVASHAPGSTVEVELIRKGKTKTLNVTLGERKGNGGEGGPSAPEAEETLGMGVQEITPELAKMLNVEVKEGLVVTSVERGGPAARAGIRRGDVIIEVNQREVKDLESYQKALGDPERGDSALFAVQRGRTTSYLVVKIPKKDAKE